MSRNLRIPSLSLFLALAAGVSTGAHAQTYLRGEVEASQVTGCYYCPIISQFVIHGTETPISSSVVNLTAYLAQHVLLTGTWGGTAALPVFDVTAVQPISSEFAINGNSSIGNTIRFNASGANGDFAVNVVSLNAGITPISPTTTFLLAPSQAVVLGLGVISGGTLRSDLVIPSNPSLVGMHLFGQALIAPASGADFHMTEPDAKRVQ